MHYLRCALFDASAGVALNRDLAVKRLYGHLCSKHDLHSRGSTIIARAPQLPKQQLGNCGKIIALAVCKALGARQAAAFGLLQQATRLHEAASDIS